MVNSEQGAVFPAASVREGVIDFLKQTLAKDCFDTVLIPARLPGSDSFPYLLIQDESFLENSYPLPPVMSVQGARAISSLTGHGKGKKRIAVLLRPCELRATVELFKLGQVNLDNVSLITIDCPGALPLAYWAEDSEKAGEEYSQILKGESSDNIRPVCQICDRFSATGAEDLHIGTLGAETGGFMLVPGSPKGKAILDCIGVSVEADTSTWKNAVDKLTTERKKRREQAYEELAAKATGLDNLINTFSQCINCHNCMRVCPICYCQQCFFDSDNMKFAFDDYLHRAETAGGLKLPPDTLLFHIGRMLHMSLSCVSCGACEDACPTDIPVAQVFSLIGSKNQEEFDYLAGRSYDEPLPLRKYEEEEFEEVEQSYVEASAKEET